ncbi:MAG: M23 family metallopeptidase [Candidatus Hydrogenedens sp.]
MRFRLLLLTGIVLSLSFIFSCQNSNISEKLNVNTELKSEESPDLLLEEIYSKEEEEEIEVSFNEMADSKEMNIPEGIEFSKKVPHLWPIKDNSGYISSWFGGSRSKGGGRTRVHKGIDIIVPLGTPVIATADGIVRLSGTMRGYGLLIVVEHADGIHSAYAHLSKLLVKVGDVIKEGDILGLSGATGRVTTAHLHYEVRKGEKSLNPLWFLPAMEE